MEFIQKKNRYQTTTHRERTLLVKNQAAANYGSGEQGDAPTAAEGSGELWKR
jgi:hypothetical protein